MSEGTTNRVVSFDPRIVLRPRSLDEVLDLTFAYLRIHFRDFRRLFLLQLSVGLVISLVFRLLLEQNWNIIWAVAFLVVPLTEKVVVVFGGDHLFGNAASVRLALRRVGLRLLPLSAGALLAPLPILPPLLVGVDIEATIGFAVMASLFWPFVLAWFLFFGTTLLLENLGLAATFRRSASLVRFRLGRAIAFVFVGFQIRVAIVITIELFTQFIFSFVLQLGTPFEALFGNGGSYASVIAFFLAAPVVALARMFDYVDTRTRLEGWDLQVRFRALVSKSSGSESELAA